MLIVNGNPVPIENIISPIRLETYRKEHETILDQMSWVKNSLFILEKIASFPFGMVESSQTIFWRLTQKAFFDSIVIALDTLVAESGQRFSVSQFQQKIQKKYLLQDIHPNLRNELKKQIDGVDFDNRIAKVRLKLKELRNQHIAHLDYETNLGHALYAQYGMELTELQEGLEIAYQLFKVLSFNGIPYIDNYTYRMARERNLQTDIDDLLTFVASQTSYLRQFTVVSNQNNQTRMIAQLSPDDQKLLNHWRERVDNLFGEDK